MNIFLYILEYMNFKRQLELLAYLPPALGTVFKTVKFI